MSTSTSACATPPASVARVPGRKSSLPFMPASSVRPGMVVFTNDGEYDVVERVERVILDRPGL